MKRLWGGVGATARIRVAILLALIAGGIGTTLYSLSRESDVSGFALNLGTELIGAFVTFVLIDLLIGGVERREQVKWETQRAAEAQALQEQIAAELRVQLRSYIQGQAVSRLRAADTVEDRQAIIDEMVINDLLAGANMRKVDLKRINFAEANLSEADLSFADAQEAGFVGANLRGANLSQANFNNANLTSADLSEARLLDTRLQNAELLEINLSSAYLREANLENANLIKATITSANLARANLTNANVATVDDLAVVGRLRGATMPDGQLYDGRFNLPDDLQYEDSNDPNELAKFYGVSLEQYLEGRDQATKRLDEKVAVGERTDLSVAHQPSED